LRGRKGAKNWIGLKLTRPVKIKGWGKGERGGKPVWQGGGLRNFAARARLPRAEKKWGSGEKPGSILFCRQGGRGKVLKE